jgi:hypothetical protein
LPEDQNRQVTRRHSDDANDLDTSDLPELDRDPIHQGPPYRGHPRFFLEISSTAEGASSAGAERMRLEIALEALADCKLANNTTMTISRNAEDIGCERTGSNGPTDVASAGNSSCRR